MRDAMRLESVESTAGGGDVLDRLQRDHREVETLFARASSLRGANRLAVLDELARSLSIHAGLEERVVHRALAELVPGGTALANRADQLHDAMGDLAAHLQSADDNDQTTATKLSALQRVVQLHVSVEEGALFPALRNALDAAGLVALTAEVESTELQRNDKGDHT